MILDIEKTTTIITSMRNGKEIIRNVPTRIVHMKCDNCGVEFQRPYGKMLKTQREANEHFCSDCPPWKTSFLKSPTMKQTSLSERTYGQQIEVNGGYIATWVGFNYKFPDRVNKHGYILEHIRAIEELTDQPVPKDCEVHHVDGNKKNNEPSNLVLLSKQQHKNVHKSGWLLLYRLVEAGIIEHNHETNEYDFTELGRATIFRE